MVIILTVVVVLAATWMQLWRGVRVKESDSVGRKPIDLDSFGMSWPGSSYPESLTKEQTVPELNADRNLDGVVLTPNQMRLVNFDRKIVLEGEAVGVGNKGATSLRFRYGESGDTDINRSCFIGGPWLQLSELSIEMKKAGYFYWIRIACTRKDCRDIDFAEFCIDDIQMLGVKIVTESEIDHLIKETRRTSHFDK